ncbi:MAG: tetratricopeptide repeat protein [Pyrinomonadaceae bacterium]|nr:tetratricopeptide repeat protein [Pyrinomonadaceae bacterium]
MKSFKYVLAAVFISVCSQIGDAQNPTQLPPPPRPAPSSTPKISEIVSKNLAQINDKTVVSRERREQAYAKLLEGQRYIWSVSRSRSQANSVSGVRLARQSLQKAFELDPNLAEAYTALAELTLSSPPNDLEEAILLAAAAVKIDADSFGGHRLLARLYTIKSRLNDGTFEPNFARQAIAEWQEVGRLDPRSAEAFAFLSEFYARTKQPVERLDALRKWLSSATPLETRFYSTVLGGQSNLSPESATIKYGQALLETGEKREAIEVLSRAVADNPANEEAIELLRRAVESADGTLATIAIQALQQAVFANPENTTLIEILAQIYVQNGKVDDAAKFLREAAAKITGKSKISAADLQVTLGDIYIEANRFDESIAAYQNALTTRGIGETAVVLGEERDFAIRVFDKMIDAYKKANRPNEAKAVIDRARTVLGKADLFADKKLIAFYLETGKKPEALQTLRSLRARRADDYSLLRLEATILTDDGRVDEGTALIKNLIGKKPSANGSPTANDANEANEEMMNISSLMYDDFSNHLFIADLYSRAKRGKEAVEAVNQALTAARSTDRREIARLTLATVQQSAGDFRGAETTLRGILLQTPGNPIALNNLGYFLTERGEKLDEALKLIQQALKIEPNNSSYLDSLGWVYFKLGNLPEAEKYLKDALRFDNSSATINEHLGDVYQKQGKPELAKTAWQKAFNLASETDEKNRLKTKLGIKTLK